MFGQKQCFEANIKKKLQSSKWHIYICLCLWDSQINTGIMQRQHAMRE